MTKTTKEDARMDTMGSSTDSRTAPTVAPTLNKEPLADLLILWRDFMVSSKAAMRRAQRAGNEAEAESRKAEACTLNVCISTLEEAIAKAEGR